VASLRLDLTKNCHNRARRVFFKQTFWLNPLFWIRGNYIEQPLNVLLQMATFERVGAAIPYASPANQLGAVRAPFVPFPFRVSQSRRHSQGLRYVTRDKIVARDP
jgi:hypothetical protein